MTFNSHEKTTKNAIQIKRNESVRLSSSFVSDEFFSALDPAEEGYVHPALIVLLQRIRNEIGKPLRINSGYRSPLHNQNIGGASQSTHIFGMAADIRTDNLNDLPEIEHIAKKLGAGGIKRYNTFVHVDVWNKRTW
jgi:uncharacterized protein YcbK (DUF882 family)